MADLFGAPIGAGTAIGRQQTIHLRYDRALVGTRRKLQAHGVERAFQIEDGGKGPLRHPQHAEAAIVRHDIARTDGVDVLGAERQADDGEVALPGVQSRLEAAADAHLVGRGEGRRYRDFRWITRLGEPAGAQIDSVEFGRHVVGQRDGDARCGFRPALEVEQRELEDAGFEGPYTTYLLDLRIRAPWAPASPAKTHRRNGAARNRRHASQKGSGRRPAPARRWPRPRQAPARWRAPEGRCARCRGKASCPGRAWLTRRCRRDGHGQYSRACSRSARRRT